MSVDFPIRGFVDPGTGRFVILGSPEQGRDDNHSCDQMACSSIACFAHRGTMPVESVAMAVDEGRVPGQLLQLAKEKIYAMETERNDALYTLKTVVDSVIQICAEWKEKQPFIQPEAMEHINTLAELLNSISTDSKGTDQ